MDGTSQAIGHDRAMDHQWQFGGTLERRLAACDTVIFLDLPRWLCLLRVIRRRVRYRNQARLAMAAGCHERLSLGFIGWILSYPKQR